MLIPPGSSSICSELDFAGKIYFLYPYRWDSFKSIIHLALPRYSSPLVPVAKVLVSSEHAWQHEYAMEMIEQCQQPDLLPSPTPEEITKMGSHPFSGMHPNTSIYGTFTIDDMILNEENALTTLLHPCIPQFLGRIEAEGNEQGPQEFCVMGGGITTLTSGKGFLMSSLFNKDTLHFFNRGKKEVPFHEVTAEHSKKSWSSVMDLGLLTYILQDALKGKPYGDIDWANIPARIASQLLGTFAYMHGRYLHLDIKAANLVCNVIDGGMHVVDFGLSRKIDQHPKFPGSRVYCPPERHKGVIEPSYDLWGVGMILYELATGHHPVDTERKHYDMRTKEGVNASLVAKYGDSIPPQARRVARPETIDIFNIRNHWDYLFSKGNMSGPDERAIKANIQSFPECTQQEWSDYLSVTLGQESIVGNPIIQPYGMTLADAIVGLAQLDPAKRSEFIEKL